MRLIIIVLTLCLHSVSTFGQLSNQTRINLASFTHQANLIKVYDIDNDGNNDIITTKNDSTLLFLQNTGDMHYRPFGTLKLHSKVNDVLMYDFNTDGNLDLFVLTDSFTCFLQNSDFNFSSISLNTSTKTLELLDFTLDGQNELVINTYNHLIRLNYGIPNDTLVDFSTINPSGFMNRTKNHFKDYDLDGDLDILFMGVKPSSFGGSGIYLLRNTLGNYTLDTLVYNLPQIYISSIYFADIDLDGDMDCFYRSREYYTLSSETQYERFPLKAMYFENDTIEKVETLLQNIGGYAHSWSHKNDVQYSDLNNDSLIDVCYYLHHDRMMQLGKFINTDSGFVQSKLDGYQTLTGDTYDYEALTIADIDNDSTNEIIFTTSKIDGLYYMNNREKIIISDNSRVNAAFYLDSNYFMINKGHFRYLTKKGYLLHVDALGGVNMKRESAFDCKEDSRGESVFNKLTSTLLDFNSDGKNEIVLGTKYGSLYKVASSNSLTSWEVDTLYNSKFILHNFSIGRKSNWNGIQPSMTFSFDYNYDNDLDILTINKDSIFIKENINHDSLSAFNLFSFNNDLNYNVLQPAQLNWNYKLDFVTQQRDSNLIDLVEFISGEYIHTHTLEGHLRFVADVNQDGLDDILTSNQIYINTETDFEIYNYNYVNPKEFIVNINDYNHDNRLDIITIDSTINTRIYYSTLEGYFDSTEVLDQYFVNGSYNIYSYRNTLARSFDMNNDNAQEFLVGVSSYENSNSNLFLYINDDYSSLTPNSNNENYLNHSLLKLHPNPATHVVYINGEDKIKNLEFFDNLGRFIKQIDLNGSNKFFVGDLNTGIHFIKMKSEDNKIYYEKLIKY